MHLERRPGLLRLRPSQPRSPRHPHQSCGPSIVQTKNARVLMWITLTNLDIHLRCVASATPKCTVAVPDQLGGPLTRLQPLMLPATSHLRMHALRLPQLLQQSQLLLRAPLPQKPQQSQQSQILVRNIGEFDKRLHRVQAIRKTLHRCRQTHHHAIPRVCHSRRNRLVDVQLLSLWLAAKKKLRTSAE